MVARIFDFALRQRVLVLLGVAALAAAGLWSAVRLPIDAVPDITNNQIQINVLYPSLSPVEIEKQVTFPIETALAGIPGQRQDVGGFLRIGLGHDQAPGPGGHGVA